MPKEIEEGEDDEEEYWRRQQAGVEDDSDDEEYSPEVRPAHLLHLVLVPFCPQKRCLRMWHRRPIRYLRDAQAPST